MLRQGLATFFFWKSSLELYDDTKYRTQLAKPTFGKHNRFLVDLTAGVYFSFFSNIAHPNNRFFFFFFYQPGSANPINKKPRGPGIPKHLFREKKNGVIPTNLGEGAWYLARKRYSTYGWPENGVVP